VPLNYQLLDSVSLEKIQTIYRERFADPGSFTFIFVGKIDPKTTKPLFEKYLASLPAKKRTETFKDHGIRPPKGKVTNDFMHENKTPRTSIFCNFNGTCDYTASDKLLGAALRHILELRLTQSIREDEAGAYSVRISFSLEKNPASRFLLSVSFDTDPIKADKLLSIVHREVAGIIDTGPTETDLSKAKEFFLKQRPEDLKENTWWGNTLFDYYFYLLDYLSGFEAKVNALSVSSVRDFARKTLNQGNEVKVIMRPEEE
jgi:zinc protease